KEKLSDDRFLWVRNNGSTLLSQAIDTIIFVSIAFYRYAIQFIRYHDNYLCSQIDHCCSRYSVFIYCQEDNTDNRLKGSTELTLFLFHHLICECNAKRLAFCKFLLRIRIKLDR
ncbi:MAG: VUT family protein, partial [Candidatus Cloacimonetes bacterium]|nr:VUT family protein [Candidatus Cloacimonadota bacterium]